MLGHPPVVYLFVTFLLMFNVSSLSLMFFRKGVLGDFLSKAFTEWLVWIRGFVWDIAVLLGAPILCYLCVMSFCWSLHQSHLRGPSSFSCRRLREGMAGMGCTLWKKKQLANTCTGKVIPSSWNTRSIPAWVYQNTPAYVNQKRTKNINQRMHQYWA